MSDMSRREWFSVGAALFGGSFPGGTIAQMRNNPIRLSLNENPFGPSPSAIQAIKSHLSGLSRYPQDEVDELTETIAVHENIAASQVLLGEILDEFGLYLSARGGRGGEFIYSEPGYTALVHAVSPAGGTVIGVPLNDRLENDLAAIADRVNARTRAIYFVNPHNPSGIVGDAGRFLDEVRALSKQTLVIVDEAYLEFVPDFEARTAAALTGSGENVAVFRTFSKIYGLAAPSIGYTLAPADLVSEMKNIGMGAFYALSRLAVVAATASLRDKRYVATIRTQVAAERETWHNLFRKLKIRFADSHGNFVFFDAGRPHDEVAAALAKKGIEIGRTFHPLDTWVRISIGSPNENAIARDAVAGLLR